MRTVKLVAVWFMVATPNAHRPFDTPRVAVKDHVRVCYPIEDFHYGMREFAIFDNNGYLLQFGQPTAQKEIES